MASFEENLEKIQRTLGRNVTPDELRLLRLWDLTSRPDSREAMMQQHREPDVQAQEEYEGRFKIAYSRDQYEVYFVCANLMLKPVLVQNKDDVVFFLTQDPINFDELTVQQAVAAAENLRPTMINHSVVLAEPFLRSMGFER